MSGTEEDDDEEDDQPSADTLVTSLRELVIGKPWWQQQQRAKEPAASVRRDSFDIHGRSLGLPFAAPLPPPTASATGQRLLSTPRREWYLPNQPLIDLQHLAEQAGVIEWETAEQVAEVVKLLTAHICRPATHVEAAACTSALSELLELAEPTDGLLRWACRTVCRLAQSILA